MTLPEAIKAGKRIDLSSDLTRYAIINGVNVHTARDRQARGLAPAKIIEPVSPSVRRSSLIRELGLDAIIQSEWRQPLAVVLALLAKEGCTQGDAAAILSVTLRAAKNGYSQFQAIPWPAKLDGLGTLLLQRTKVEGQYLLDGVQGTVPELAVQLKLNRSQVYHRLEELKRQLLRERYTPFARRTCRGCKGAGKSTVQSRIGGFTVGEAVCATCRGFGTLPE